MMISVTNDQGNTVYVNAMQIATVVPISDNRCILSIVGDDSETFLRLDEPAEFLVKDINKAYKGLQPDPAEMMTGMMSALKG